MLQCQLLRLLDIALDHLTLGRAAFYAVMLGPRGIGFQPVEQRSSDKGRLEAYPTVTDFADESQQGDFEEVSPGLLTTDDTEFTGQKTRVFTCDAVCRNC